MKVFGFTLIELLISLALVGVLCAICYPVYTDHLVKVHRTSVVAALSDISGRIEEYYAWNNTYSNATLDNLGVDNGNYKDYYQVVITSQDNTYTLRADPIGTQSEKDQRCGSLMLDQSGNKSTSGPGGTEECW